MPPRTDINQLFAPARSQRPATPPPQAQSQAPVQPQPQPAPNPNPGPAPQAFANAAPQALNATAFGGNPSLGLPTGLPQGNVPPGLQDLFQALAIGALPAGQQPNAQVPALTGIPAQQLVAQRLTPDLQQLLSAIGARTFGAPPALGPQGR